MTQQNSLDSYIENFQQLIEQPDCFLDCDESLQMSIKSNLKQIYDFSKSQEIKITLSAALPELLLRNFDNEQIWQQIELQNDTILPKSLETLSKLFIMKEKLVFKNLAKEINDHEEKEYNSENEDESSGEEEDKGNEPGGSKSREEVDISEASSEELDLRDIDGSDEEDKNKNESHDFNRESTKKTIVDDDFFKLEEMEKFLSAEEKKLHDPDSGNDSEDSGKESEDDINFFEDNADEEDDKVRTAKYKDFFVAKEENKTSKRNNFLKDMSDGDDEQVKSTYEIRQERLKQKIDKIEHVAISEKPWPLKGEIKADNRPYNSLLEEVVEFDLTSRPAPLITEKTTLQLEDIIRQRIKDKVFDSPERKVKPVETPLEYKKKLVLDQEKSKHSLAQIYEKEFLQQQAALNSDNADKEEIEDESHKDLRKLMHSLFSKLDALSNFHFTPKPAMPELKIVNNLPALSMEEVTPITATAASLLAPEEVRNKAKGDILGKSEKTGTDKKRERRKKKQKQRYHTKQINKNLLTKGKEKQDANKKHLMKHITKDRNIQKMDEKTNSKSLKSSKAFFTQLQEQVQTHISGKMKKKRKNTENKLQAKKFKL